MTTQRRQMQSFGRRCAREQSWRCKNTGASSCIKKAGVVDAGGMGLCLIMNGMLSYIKNGEIIQSQDDLAVSEDIKDDSFFKRRRLSLMRLLTLPIVPSLSSQEIRN